MAKVQEIGPYSAYAIAVKYGYQGTEEEWVQEQEANRKAAEAAAAAAEQSAKNAAATTADVAQSGQQAVQNIKNAQTAAVQAIDTAKQQAVQAAQAEAEKAAASAGQAASSAAEAAQSATSAAAEVGKVQSAGTAAVQSVQAAQNTATGAVSAAQQTATQAVSEAQATAVSAVQEAGTTQTSAVESAGTVAVSAVSNAKTEALSQISNSGAAQVSAVGTAGTSAVEDVNDAKTAALEEIDAANAALPSPTQSDAGKVPTVKADGSAYELAGPYAPLSAAIRPTANGNPVSITDSVEWPLLGLKVYGKSTQVTTTGAQLFDASTALDSTWIIVGSGEIEAANGFWTSDYIPVQPGQYFSSIKGSSRTALYDAEKQFVRYFGYNGGSAFTISEGGTYIRITGSNDFPPESVMFNAGSTAKPWEPYTGGQASPSPNYPQEIVSAGSDGQVKVTVCGANFFDSSLIPSKTHNGVSCTVLDDGSIYLSGTPTATAVFSTYVEAENYVRLPQTFLTASIHGSGNNSGHVYALFRLRKGSEDVADFASTTTDSRTVDISGIDYDNIQLGIQVSPGNSVNKNFKIMVNVGQNSAPWSPYSGFQSLTISTPNGLPGIHVDSGGNYTDTEGQQSACDVKDYGTGKYTQMVGHIESYNGENITTPYMSTTGQLSTGAEVYYVLDEPVVTDISADELTAYRTLHAYDGATVVSTPEDVAGIEVRYVADGEKYIDRKISEGIASAAETKLASYDTLSGAIHEGVNEA